jgi:DNA polymerase-3 subunit epsilon
MMNVYLKKNTFTLVDVETTGGSPYYDRVIEVGIIRVVRGEVKQTLSTLINPGVSIPGFITGITGIRDAHVKKAPKFEKVFPEINKLFKGSIFVAHNVNFDYHFLRGEYLRLGKDFEMPKMCTVRLSRALYPEHKRHGLSAIIERFGFECEDRHRALGDAQVLWDFMQKIQQDFKPSEISKALNLVGDWR